MGSFWSSLSRTFQNWSSLTFQKMAERGVKRDEPQDPEFLGEHLAVRELDDERAKFEPEDAPLFGNEEYIQSDNVVDLDDTT